MDVKPYYPTLWSKDPQERVYAHGSEFAMDSVIANRIIDMYEGKNGLPRCSCGRIAMAVIGKDASMDGQQLVRIAYWSLGREREW